VAWKQTPVAIWRCVQVYAPELNRRSRPYLKHTKLVLTAEDLKEIDSALAGFKVHGGRMNEEQMRVVDQNRFSDGQIVEERGQPDLLGLLQQIGAIPS
jgi:hypothetical protein